MKNPKECFCIRQNQTFFIENELEKPEYEDNGEPLLFHHDTFSRFKFVIINAEKKAAFGNINVKEFPAIFWKIRWLCSRDMLAGEQEKNGKTQSAAYTTVITAGKLKGKTPAELLLENAEENKVLLIQQKAWLEANAGKYPKNSIQIQAIEDGIRLYANGQLDKSTARTSGRTEKTVFSSGVRPLIRRKNAEGKSFVYEINIRWLGGMEKPVEIEIRNYYAPVIQKENGLLNVMVKERTNEIRNVFCVTAEQWLWMEHILETNIRTFEDIHAEPHYRLAREETKKNMEQAKNTGKAAS